MPFTCSDVKLYWLPSIKTILNYGIYIKSIDTSIFGKNCIEPRTSLKIYAKLKNLMYFYKLCKLSQLKYKIVGFKILFWWFIEFILWQVLKIWIQNTYFAWFILIHGVLRQFIKEIQFYMGGSRMLHCFENLKNIYIALVKIKHNLFSKAENKFNF